MSDDSSGGGGGGACNRDGNSMTVSPPHDSRIMNKTDRYLCVAPRLSLPMCWNLYCFFERVYFFCVTALNVTDIQGFVGFPLFHDGSRMDGVTPNVQP